MTRSLPERVGQTFVDEADVLVVIDRAVYPYDPQVPAWILLSLENGQRHILSEDWVRTHEQLGHLVKP